MHPALPALIVCLAAPAAVPLLQVGAPEPVLLDLRRVDLARLVPGDLRDPAAAEAARQAWGELTAPLARAASVRVALPSRGERLPLLLAASQALKAQWPERPLYVAYDPEAEPLMDEAAWGAVDGGALMPEDLGSDPLAWRDRLMHAQERFPGRPWFLWAPRDPGGLASVLLGDGGRLVVPAGGAAARLAARLDPAFGDVEGGQDVLTLRARKPRREQTWRFVAGEWAPSGPMGPRNEVEVTAEAPYDVPELLARVRATQLRDRAALRTLEAAVDYELHFQGERGSGDLGFTFLGFERLGEPEELLRREVRLNGVRAKLGGDFQLPLVESRSSVAIPVALTLTERYRYEDGGPEGPGRRRLRFAPVDGDALLFAGELMVEESTGRILEERSRREGLPGVVRSESRVLTYGELAPGIWRVVKSSSRERWALGRGTVQVHRTLTYRNPKVNAPGFEAARAAARAGDGSILRQTPEGFRYYVKQADGSRRIEEKVRTRGRAWGGLVVVDPQLDIPVLPLAGLALWDFDAFGRGIQYNVLTAVLYNQGSLMVPNIGLGVDLSASATLMAFKGDERPSQGGRELDRDAVSRRSQMLRIGLGRDLGRGFRLSAEGRFQHDAFGEARDEDTRTPGFLPPPSGWTRLTTGTLSWQGGGFQARGFYGTGQRPAGSFGLPEAPQAIAEGGRFRRYGGALGYDHDLGGGLWLNAGAGLVAGRGFDRFESVDVSEFVQGIRAHALATDRVHHADLRFVVPTGPRLRLTLGLEHARARSLEDGRVHAFTGATLAGDLPGFGWFTTVRVDLGIGLQSPIAGTKGASGTIALLRLF